MHSFPQDRSIPCTAWAFGLLLLGAVCWYLLYSYVIHNKAPSIELEIGNASSAALATQANLVNVSSDVDGRDITLSGAVTSAEARQRAEQIAQEIQGVRQINNDIIINESKPLSIPPAPKMILSSSARIEALPDSFPPLEETEDSAQERNLDMAQQRIDALDLSAISFLPGSATLTDHATEILNEITSMLTQHPDVRVHITGHTDSTGDPDFNLDLSSRRAQSVVDYMVNQGIEVSRLTAEGHGDQEPIASNDTNEGRSKNRRIEFKLINGEN